MCPCIGERGGQGDRALSLWLGQQGPEYRGWAPETVFRVDTVAPRPKDQLSEVLRQAGEWLIKSLYY